MGLLGKAALVAGGYYIYKRHQDKKKTQRGEEHFANQRDAPQMNSNDYYPRDNKSQYGDNNYPRDSKSQLEYPPQHNANPSYASVDRKSEYA